MTGTKKEFLAALSAFALQRPRLNRGDYGSWRDFQADMKIVVKVRGEFLKLLREVEGDEGVTLEDLLGWGGGRLEWLQGKFHYTPAFYWSLEYRPAAVRVLENARACLQVRRFSVRKGEGK